jgi:hypothetical protein
MGADGLAWASHVALSLSLKEGPQKRSTRTEQRQSPGWGRKIQAFGKNWNLSGGGVSFLLSVKKWVL